MNSEGQFHSDVSCTVPGQRGSAIRAGNFREGGIEYASLQRGFSHQHLSTLNAVPLGKERRKEGGRKEEMKKTFSPSPSSYCPTVLLLASPTFLVKWSLLGQPLSFHKKHSFLLRSVLNPIFFHFPLYLSF